MKLCNSYRGYERRSGKRRKVCGREDGGGEFFFFFFARDFARVPHGSNIDLQSSHEATEKTSKVRCVHVRGCRGRRKLTYLADGIRGVKKGRSVSGRRALIDIVLDAPAREVLHLAKAQ